MLSWKGHVFENDSDKYQWFILTFKSFSTWHFIVYNERFAGVTSTSKSTLHHVESHCEMNIFLYQLHTVFTRDFIIFFIFQLAYIYISAIKSVWTNPSMRTALDVFFYLVVSGLSGQGLCSTEQRGKRVQPRSHHIQGSGGTLWMHPRPPTTDITGHDCPREKGRGCRQVLRSFVFSMSSAAIFFYIFLNLISFNLSHNQVYIFLLHIF